MILLDYELDGRNVPVISDAAIDRDAERLLRDFDRRLLADPQPLDIEAFAEDYLGLKIHYDNLSHNGCIWGTMVFVNSQIPIYDIETERAEYKPIDADTIIIDNSIAEGDREEIFRSSLGHECGHSVYHRQYFEHRLRFHDFYSDEDDYGLGFAACRRSDIIGSQAGRRRFKTAREFIEHHAKRFSAALLMPVSAMRIVCGDKDFRESARGEEPDLANAILAEEVADTFNVSNSSALIRIQQLKLGIKSYPNSKSVFKSI